MEMNFIITLLVDTIRSLTCLKTYISLQNYRISSLYLLDNLAKLIYSKLCKMCHVQCILKINLNFIYKLSLNNKIDYIIIYYHRYKF